MSNQQEFDQLFQYLMKTGAPLGFFTDLIQLYEASSNADFLRRQAEELKYELKLEQQSRRRLEHTHSGAIDELIELLRNFSKSQLK